MIVRFYLNNGDELSYRDVGAIEATHDSYILWGLDKTRLADVLKQAVHFMIEEDAHPQALQEGNGDTR